MKRVKYILLILIASQFTIGGCSQNNSPQDGGNNSSNNSGQNGKYLLRLDPTVGSKGKLVMTIDADINMEVMGQQMTTGQLMEMASDLEVVENTSASVTTKMAYDYVSISMDVPMMGKMEYDTRKTDNTGMMADAMSAAFDKIIGQEITMVQSHNGKTIKMEGMEDVIEMSEGQNSMNITSLMSMSQFPEKAIAIGETWKKEIDEQMSKYSFDATYTLAKVEDGKVYIDLQSDVTIKEDIDTGESSIGTEAVGTQSGTFVYNQKTMWLIEALMQQDFDMTVEQMGMTIPMNMKGNITLVME